MSAFDELGVRLKNELVLQKGPSSCPVSIFTDASFIIVLYMENAFWAAEEFFCCNIASGRGQNWMQGCLQTKSTNTVFIEQKKCSGTITLNNSNHYISIVIL